MQGASVICLFQSLNIILTVHKKKNQFFSYSTSTKNQYISDVIIQCPFNDWAFACIF